VQYGIQTSVYYVVTGNKQYSDPQNRVFRGDTFDQTYGLGLFLFLRCGPRHAPSVTSPSVDDWLGTGPAALSFKSLSYTSVTSSSPGLQDNFVRCGLSCMLSNLSVLFCVCYTKAVPQFRQLDARFLLWKPGLNSRAINMRCW
jgi:hypothetical protein